MVNPSPESVSFLLPSGAVGELTALPPAEETAAALPLAEFERFEGGQLRIENDHEGYLFQGEIKDVAIVEERGFHRILVEWAWLAQSVGGVWSRIDLPYGTNLELCKVEENTEERLRIRDVVTHECLLFTLSPEDALTLS